MKSTLPTVLSKISILVLSVSAVGLLTVQAAHGAVINSVSPTLAGSSDSASSCTINSTINVTAEGDHIGRTDRQPDRARLRIGTDGNANFLTTFRDGNFLAPAMATSDVEKQLTITDLSNVSGDLSYVALEQDNHASGAMNGDTIFTQANAISPAFLRSIPAAGGFCEQLADALDGGGGGTANTAPVANAGPDQNVSVAPGEAIVLDGSGSSDANGDTLTYAWTQTSGPTVTLADVNTASPMFDAPASDAVFEFSLVVNDGTVDSPADTVTITYIVPAANNTPVADAGADQTVSAVAGTVLSLNGSGSSDPDGDTLTYMWTQTSGPTVTLSDPAAANPTFEAPSADANLAFSLVVNDGTVDSVADATNIAFTATLTNQAPLADAGSDVSLTVSPGATITLDGSASTDPDGGVLTYAWTQTSGATVTLSDARAAMPTFNAPASDSTFVFSLIVNDGTDDSVPDDVTVTYTADLNAAPVADAGADQSVDAAAGATITLDGSASSDPDGNTLTYVWTQTSGPAVTLSDADTATPSFVAPDASADFTFSLVVNDGTMDSVADATNITFRIENMGPVADAGEDQTLTAAPATVIKLDGSASSDPEGDALTYVWTQTAGPTVTLADSTSANPSFGAPSEAAVLTFSLVVNDGIVDSAADTVRINYTADEAPVADAGQDIQTAGVAGTTVTLDAGRSTDADSGTLTYAWTQIQGPTVTLVSANTATPSFVVPNVQSTQTLVFEVSVSDGTSNATDRVEVTIEPSGSVTLVVQTDGTDGSFTFASPQVAELRGSVVTVGGTGSLVSAELAGGRYTVSLADARENGFVLSSIACDDADSSADASGGTANLAVSPGEDLICTFSLTNRREITSAAVRSMLVQRNTLLLSTQPSLSRRTARLNGGAGGARHVSIDGFTLPGSERLPLLASIGNDRAAISASLAALSDQKPRKYDVWIEGVHSGFDLAGDEGDFGVFYAGVDMLTNENTLVGVMAQYDTFESETGGGDFVSEGKGFMVGPYATMKIGSGVYLDGRVLWGQSDNTIAVNGTGRSDFDTSRWLLAGSLSGQHRFDDKSSVTPTFTVRHITDKQKAFLDSFGVQIDSQTVSHTELSFAPRFEKVFTTDEGGEYATFATMEGIYSFGSDFEAVFANQLRARLEGGLSIRPTNGLVFNISGFTDGLGSNQFENTGVRFSLGKTFN